MTESRPLIAAHVGVTVPDVEAAVAFYTRALDLVVLVPPTDVPLTNDHTGAFLGTFFPGFGGMRAARVINDAGFALELFEWVLAADAPSPPRSTGHETPGYFHVAFIDPDVEGRARRIVAAGGRRRTETWQVWPGRPFLACYCEDPFGNIVEIISHDELTMHGPS